MSPTRRTVRPGPARLAGAAVILLLAACGGGGDDADSSGAGDTSESAATETSAAAGEGDFCAQAAELDERVESALSDLEGDDPSVADAFDQLSQELRAMDPPDEIAADWDAMAGGLDRLAAAFADFDLTDPDSLAALEEAEGELTTASENVETYLRDECGIDP
jgi:hypothetical protein